MNKKAQELEVRTIMQGLEEFATFMSFRGNSSGLRILSVETVSQFEQPKHANKKADIIKIPNNRISISNSHDQQQLHKSLNFQSTQIH
ncbi:MAG: hypothetical protein OEY48_05510 [Gammaproteobacteria bacterium]|nr:hypothetical protein [Gammaproteobacteria bacterium]MDH5592289.1 hypothetical protein [Gammaproteobacteria bacterium]